MVKKKRMHNTVNQRFKPIFKYTTVRWKKHDMILIKAIICAGNKNNVKLNEPDKGKQCSFVH